MRRRRFDGNPIEALRRADPLDPANVVKDTAGVHARALFQEVTSMDTKERTSVTAPAVPLRRRFGYAAVGLTLVVAAVTGIALFRGDGTSPAETIVGGDPIASAGMCVETYSLDTLAGRDVAFDGTLSAVEGDRVTFTVQRWFTGGSGGEVTLDANGLVDNGITLLGGPGLEEGRRYLVSGSGGFVWACGFTMTYDTAIAQQWAQVFAG